MRKVDRTKLAGWTREKSFYPFLTTQQRAPCWTWNENRKINVMQVIACLGWGLFLLSCIFSEKSIAAEKLMLTEEESQAISTLVNTPAVVELNKDVQSLSEDVYLQDSLKEDMDRSLLSLTAEVKAASKQLVSAIEDGGEDEERSALLKIGRLAKKVKSLKEDLARQEDLLSETRRELRLKSRQLAVQNEQLCKRKISLRDTIVSRLRKEAEEVSALQFQGEFQCSPQKNINQCLTGAGRKADIIMQASAKVDSLWEVKDIAGYTITEATMGLDGTVNYKGRFNYKRMIGEKVLAYINDLLGLSQFIVMLHSNDTVEYFVDGNAYGEGREIGITLDSGAHSFYVKGKNGSASVVRHITEDMKLYLPISDKVAIPQLNPPKSLAKPKRVKKKQMLGKNFTISNVQVSLPVSKRSDEQDTYIDQGNNLRRLSFFDGVEFCKRVNGRIASQLEYTNLLQSPDFQNQIGFKSSYWLNKGIVLSRMGSGMLAKQVLESDKYSVVCIKNTGI
ncbi:hypothetical protein DBR13_17310 [Aeromonas sp. HMWF015]|nr:hypothetical protein DBR13_17310 [Aeromonas sp. HMWF015]